MVITSNLTTLNLEGDSSSDGGGTGEPKTVLDAFRKRQARMNDLDAINREDNKSDGAEIDIQEDLQGARFVIKNPNATTTCSCGSSFS